MKFNVIILNGAYGPVALLRKGWGLKARAFGPMGYAHKFGYAKVRLRLRAFGKANGLRPLIWLRQSCLGLWQGQTGLRPVGPLGLGPLAHGATPQQLAS